MFFTYIVFEEALFSGLVVIYFLLLRSVAPLTACRWVLVIGIAIAAILQLATLYQTANVLIVNRLYLARALRPVLKGGAVLLIFGASVVSALFSQNGMQRS
jgi:predicted benzoate:H+ symporter BenE